MADADGPISSDDYKVIVMSLGLSREGRGFSEDEVRYLGDWLIKARTDLALWQLIEAGELTIDWNGREAVFHRVDAQDVGRVRGVIRDVLAGKRFG